MNNAGYAAEGAKDKCRKEQMTGWLMADFIGCGVCRMCF